MADEEKTQAQPPSQHGQPDRKERPADAAAGRAVLAAEESAESRPGEVAGHTEGVVGRREVFASGAFGIVMLVAAVAVIVDAIRLPETSEAVGPAAIPLPVGVLLGVVGAALLVRARLQLPAAATTDHAPPGAGLRITGMVIALIGFALLLPLLGYVVTATALYTAAATLLGAPSFWRTLASGWALAAIVFLLFDRLIGLSLPAGPWGF